MTVRQLLLTVALVLASVGTALGVPLSLAHQGYLADAEGETVTGSVVINFSLWDEAEGGSQAWSESRTVDVVDGSYSTLLGSEMPIADVLRQEPALWLQLEIAGEALLPRHPVASAPYAVVADTAVNVDGGTVNASSVSVGGNEVIDATGAWAGAAGSIDWGAIGGAPANADTLAGLSCANGAVAKFDAGSGTWMCDTGADTLAALPCADGELAKWDATASAWECGIDRYDKSNAYTRTSASGTVYCDDASDLLLMGGCTEPSTCCSARFKSSGPVSTGGSGAFAADATWGWWCDYTDYSGTATVLCLDVP